MADHAHPSSASHGYHGHASGAGSGGAHGSADHAADRDPVCGMRVDPATPPHHAAHDGAPTTSARRLPRTKFLADPARYLGAADARPSARAGRRASTPARCIPRSARRAPAAARSAAWRWSRIAVGRRRTQSGARDMTRRFWVGACAHGPRLRARDGWSSLGLHHVARPAGRNWVQLAAGDAGRAVGRLPFFARGWPSLLSRHLNMFTLIAHRHRRGVRLQRPRHYCARPFPAAAPQPTARCRSISRRQRSSRCWCCSGRCSSCGRASRPVGAIRALLDLAPKTARRLDADGRKRRCRSSRSRSAIGCACGRARSVPVDGDDSRGPQHDRRIDGHRRAMPVDKAPGRAVIGGTVNQAGGFVMRAEKVGARHHAGADRAAGGAGAAQPRARAAAGRSGVGVVRARGAGVAFARLRRLGALGPGAAPRLSRWSRRSRVLIIACPCALGPRHADVDHGGVGPRRAGRRADQERGGPGAAGGGRHPRRRQDRHAYRRQAQRRRRQVPTGHVDEDELLAPGGERRAAERAPAGRGDRAGCRATADLALAAVRATSESPPGKGAAGAVAGRQVVHRQPPLPERARGSTRGALGRAGRGAAQRGATAMLCRRSTASLPASSPLPMR